MRANNFDFIARLAALGCEVTDCGLRFGVTGGLLALVGKGKKIGASSYDPRPNRKPRRHKKGP